ncbi:predicted protein [Plenodomus lingam JN3]|uniref:Predicted protein n=1 Tax=Leptosphaeria maculans (strain JN3 / isolate v23.1.3 / race Av1-4-5-6-7-8) TaxID=985895 RepID=E5A1H7_LEPMJ|nr:predicted protein [Plenodomus lingam JN3]CBX97441.1 predicted protein [Plenodomus lingam JN3]
MSVEYMNIPWRGGSATIAQINLMQASYEIYIIATALGSLRREIIEQTHNSPEVF